MNNEVFFEVLLVVLLILANGFFAGAEIAIVALRKTRLHELVDSGHSAAQAVMSLRDQPERFLATVQVGITVVSATAAAVGGSALADRLVPLLAKISWLADHSHQVALGLVVAVVSYLSIVVGELVPKSLALRAAEQYSLIVARPLLALSWLARPLIWFLTASSNLVLRPFGDTTTFTESRHSPEELQQLVGEATKAGTLHPHAAEIASRALDLPELIVADVMVPRQDVLMLPKDVSAEDLRRTLMDNIHSRIPVYDGTIDNVVGYVSVKDLLRLAWQQKSVQLSDVLRPPIFVPESKLAVDLLQEMRQRRTPFVIVVDEQGGIAGIVTMEDLIEELVGEIFSEHVRQAPSLIRKEPTGTVLLGGAVPVRDVNRALDIELPEDGSWTTIAGLCLALAGRIPGSGDKLELPNRMLLEVVDASPRRVRAVRLHLPADNREC